MGRSARPGRCPSRWPSCRWSSRPTPPTPCANSLRPYSAEYQVEQIVSDAPFASVAVLPLPEAEPGAMLQTNDFARQDRERAARQREVADYSLALASLGRLGEAVEAATRLRLLPAPTVRTPAGRHSPTAPLETLLRPRSGPARGGQGDRSSPDRQERGAHMLVAVAHEHMRREQPELAWATGKEALGVFSPKASVKSIAPGAPRLMTTRSLPPAWRSPGFRTVCSTRSGRFEIPTPGSPGG